jgi:hypothetical protein
MQNGYFEKGYLFTKTINHFGTVTSINNPTMTKISSTIITNLRLFCFDIEILETL